MDINIITQLKQAINNKSIELEYIYGNTIKLTKDIFVKLLDNCKINYETWFKF